jgi:hypothetical protein
MVPRGGIEPPGTTIFSHMRSQLPVSWTASLFRRARFASHQENAFAVRLPVEQLVGLLRLVERPAVREQLVDIDLAVDAELRALGLDDGGEGPGRDQRHLAPEQVRADVDRHVAALAHETHGAPDLRAADGIETCLAVARCIERQIGVFAVCQFLDRRDGVVGARIDQLVGAELPRALQPLRVGVERDHPRPHRLGELGAGQADRPLAEDRNRVPAGDVHAPKRAIGGAGAARDRRARREAQALMQRHHRVGRHLQVPGMPAVRIVAIDLHRHLLAELLPAGAAMAALGAALIVMHHHAVADPGFRGTDARPCRHDDAAGLVPGNDGIGARRYAGACPGQVLRAAVLVQVGPAHAGGLHFKHHFPRSRRGIGEGHDLDGTFTGKHDATHGFLRFLSIASQVLSFNRPRCRPTRRR